jgi:hypothetical protein
MLKTLRNRIFNHIHGGYWYKMYMQYYEFSNELYEENQKLRDELEILKDQVEAWAK